MLFATSYLQEDLPACADKILKAFHLDSTIHDIDTSMLKKNKNNAYKNKKRPKKIDDKRLEQFTKLNELDQDLYTWAGSIHVIRLDHARVIAAWNVDKHIFIYGAFTHTSSLIRSTSKFISYEFKVNCTPVV